MIVCTIPYRVNPNAVVKLNYLVYVLIRYRYMYHVQYSFPFLQKKMMSISLSLILTLFYIFFSFFSSLSSLSLLSYYVQIFYFVRKTKILCSKYFTLSEPSLSNVLTITPSLDLFLCSFDQSFRQYSWVKIIKKTLWVRIQGQGILRGYYLCDGKSVCQDWLFGRYLLPTTGLSQ